MSDEVDRQAFDEAAGQSRGRLKPSYESPVYGRFRGDVDSNFHVHEERRKLDFSLCVVSAQGCKGPQVQILSLSTILNQILS